MQELHDREFKKTDCLKCANCCKTTGPLFTIADVERISKHFRQKPQQFIDQYLRIDEDNDYVLQSVPCTFLDAENYCMIYDANIFKAAFSFSFLLQYYKQPDKLLHFAT